MTGNWNASGATEDTTYYHGKFNWFNSKTISISPFMQGGKVREALGTNKSRALNEKDRTFKALNRDRGAYVSSITWKSLLIR